MATRRNQRQPATSPGAASGLAGVVAIGQLHRAAIDQVADALKTVGAVYQSAEPPTTVHEDAVVGLTRAYLGDMLVHVDRAASDLMAQMGQHRSLSQLVTAEKRQFAQVTTAYLQRVKQTKEQNDGPEEN